MPDLIRQFKEEVYDHGDEIDADEEHHWGTLAYGYFLGKGLSPDEARDLASEARYKYQVA